MFLANLRGVKRLAVSLVLVSGFAGLGLTATDFLGRAAAQDRVASTAKAEQARDLMRQAREAYDAKNYGKAKDLAQQAQGLRAPSAFYDETPEDLLADIAKKPGMASRASKPTTTDPKILMNMAKQAFDAGELDKAQDLATQAQANQGSVRWGLFDDTPASLLKDIQKAKGRRDRDVSEKMLTEARQLIEKRAGTASERAGNLYVAEEKAKLADKMHGPYSMWDFSDRPDDLVAEVKKLREKEKLLNVKPDGPAYAQFKPVRAGSMDLADPRPSKIDSSTPSRPIVRTSGTGDDALARKKVAVALMQEANALKQGGHYAEARIKLIEASRKNAWFGKDEETPEAELALLNVQAQRRINTLVNESKTHLARKDTTAATVKLDEAQQLAVSMGLDTDSILEVRSTIKPTTKPSDVIVSKPKKDDLTGVPPLAPIPTEDPVPAPVVAPVVKAPKTPEVPPIVKTPEPMEVPPVVKTPDPTEKLPVIRNGGTKEPVAPAPVVGLEPPIKIDPPTIKPIVTPETPMPKPAVVVAPESPKVDKGEQLLTQARLALKSGDNDTAKKLVIEVLAGQFGNKNEAEALLNSIETEEKNQKLSATRRAFENGMATLNQGNSVGALAIFKQIDPALLPASKRPQLAQMMDLANARIKEADAALVKGPDSKLPKTPLEEIPGPMPKVGADNLLKQQEALSQVEFQKLRSEALKVESTATARFGRGETDAALQDMQNFVAKVKATNLESSKQALLTRPIEARMDRLRILKHQTDFLTKEAADRRNFRAEMAHEEMAKSKKQEEVAKLMRSANKLMDEAKYKEAYAQIQMAAQMDPDDPSVNGAMQMAERMYRMSEFKRIKSTQEKTNWELGQELYDIGNVSGKDPLKVTDDPELRARIQNRTSLKGIGIQRSRSEKEKEIERTLSTKPISLNFKGTPLEDVVTHLQTVTNINFDLDLRGLKEGNVDAKQPITLSLNQVSLKSGLNILCQHAGLKHVIENETVRITTAKNASGRSTMKSLSVGDLIVPIPNYGPQPGQFQREQLFAMMNPNNRNATPNAPARMTNLPGGAGVGTESSMGTGNAGRLTNSNGVPASASVSSPNGTLEKELIRLITTTIRPDSWAQLGGDGTIEYYPIGMALVVNQSPEVIEEVERLLESLRKLQDLEVTIELKVVSLSETFFERIGVDFAMGVRTNGSTTDPRGLASPPQAINRTNFSGNVIGLSAPGVPSPELDIPIRATSFARAIPPFGGFGNSFADGGLSLGLAFLSELQVQMFLEAAQGDTRTNVMHAPKVTAINGASAQITVGDFQFFLTGVTVQAVGGQLLFTPNNVPFLTGTANPLPPNQTVQNGVLNFQPTQTQTPGLLLFVQPVVSADRRFVRLNIRQEFVNLVSGTQQIPFTTIITPTFDNGGQGQPIPFTQYLQQPRFSNIATDTVVVVPDGGTVVMGGLKWMTEGRNEFGPPVLSKIPYLNRLFKNVAYGREGRTMLLMVTPRIVINREEQERQTGYRDDDNAGGLIVGP